MLNTKEKEWFKERVGRAITQRRQYLRYARDHRDKLAREPGDIRPAEIQITRPTSTLAPTTASTLLPERLLLHEEEFQDTQSQTSYATSLGEDDDENHQRLPSLADVSKGATVFECPLCWSVQDIQSESAWRKHAFGDLRPYVCTFKDCDTKLFPTRREWFEHELSYHRAQWCCGFCEADNFRSLKLFKDHVQSRHMQSIKDDQLHALSESSRRYIHNIPALDCPFCQEWESRIRQANPSISANEIVFVTPTNFRHHVGAHMQQLALFSTPRGFLEDSTDTNSAASSGDSHSSIDDRREAETAFEFASIEAALHELEKLHDQYPNDLTIPALLSRYHLRVGDETAALRYNTKTQVLLELSIKDDNLDQLNEEREKYKQVLQGVEKALQIDSMAVLEVKNHLDELPEDQITLDMAGTDGKRVEEDWKKLLELWHTGTSEVDNDSTSTSSNQGESKDIDHLVQTMHTKIRELGEDQPETLLSILNVATTYKEQGWLEEAKEMYHRGLNAAKGVFGEDHAYTSTCRTELSSIYWDQSKWKEAAELKVALVESSKRVRGAEHPDTIDSMDDLARLYQAQGLWGKSLELSTSVVKLSRKTLGDEHQTTQDRIYFLARALQSEGRWRESEQLLVEVLETNKRVLGSEHTRTLDSMNHLAFAYEEEGRSEEAEKLFMQVAEISKKTREQFEHS